MQLWKETSAEEIERMMMRVWERLEIRLTHQAILMYYNIWLN